MALYMSASPLRPIEHLPKIAGDSIEMRLHPNQLGARTLDLLKGSRLTGPVVLELSQEVLADTVHRNSELVHGLLRGADLMAHVVRDAHMDLAGIRTRLADELQRGERGEGRTLHVATLGCLVDKGKLVLGDAEANRTSRGPLRLRLSADGGADTVCAGALSGLRLVSRIARLLRRHHSLPPTPDR